MTALRLRTIYGTGLIGRDVNTEPMGEYPGGVAVVTELFPDPAAPEIVFTVNHPTFGEIGVFEYEQCTLTHQPT